MFHPDKDQNKLVGQDQKLPKGAAIPIPEASKSTLDPLLISRRGLEQQITLLVQEDYGSKVAASNFSLGARSLAGFVVLHPNTGRLQGVEMERVELELLQLSALHHVVPGSFRRTIVKMHALLPARGK